MSVATDRRAFLSTTLAGAGALIAGTASGQDLPLDPAPPPSAEDAVAVPMEVLWQPSWLSWVGATTTCLRALGVDCDLVDVAGVSGYAFTMAMYRDAGIAGPTTVRRGALADGLRHLGRTTLQFDSGDWHLAADLTEADQSHCRALHDLVRSEIVAGRPCVVWGTHLPEYGVVTGVANGHYQVVCDPEWVAEPANPIHMTALQAHGGLYGLAFPSATEVAEGEGDRGALVRAIEVHRQVSGTGEFCFGLDAYGLWTAALEEGVADGAGHAYCSQCYAESRQLAAEYLQRLADRNEDVAEPLSAAADDYSEAAEALGRVAAAFPFPEEDELEDDRRVAGAIGDLHRAAEAEARSGEALAEALERWPE